MTKKLTKMELVRRLATELGVTLKPAGGREASVDLPEFGLTIDVTMHVRPLVTREDRINFQEEALARIADHERGGWADGCYCRVRDRGSFAQRGSTSACKKPVIGVVVNKVERWDQTRGSYTEYSYSFRCHVHLAKAHDEVSVVYRDTLGHHALKAARDKRTKDVAERERLRKMTPEQRIAEDALAYGREDEARAIIESIPPPRRHSYRCAKLRATAHGRFPNGDPDVECTCQHDDFIPELTEAPHLPYCNRLRSPTGKPRGENGRGDDHYECTCGAASPAFNFSGER